MQNKFYWEPQLLNMKKVLVIILIVIILITCISVNIIKKNNTTESEQQSISNTKVQNKSSIFYSDDKSISIELLNSYKLKKYDSDYLLELRSDDNLNIFVDKNPAIENKNLSDLMEKDKTAFLSTFEASSNISEIKQISINDNPIYTYSFHYLDNNLNTTFYLQVMWLQINDTYYTFDVEFPLDSLSFFTNVPTSVLYSFSVNQ